MQGSGWPRQGGGVVGSGERAPRGRGAGGGVGVVTARGGRGARGRRQRPGALGGGLGARTHSRFSWSAPPQLQASTCCWISPSSAAAAPAPRAGPRRGAQREWLGWGGVRGGPAGRGRAFVCSSRRGAAAGQARAVRPPPSPGAAARSCAGLGADAAAVSPRSSLVTELRGTCSLLRSLSPPPLRSPPPASRPHRRARGGPGAATQRPAPTPAPHPPGRACARGTATPRAPSQARRGAPPASSVPGREDEVTPPPPSRRPAALRPPH